MRQSFLIASHHLRRTLRNPGLIIVLMAIPATLAAIEYAAFGQAAASGRLPAIKVLFIDEDGTFASGSVPQFFAGGPMKDYFELANTDSRATAKRLFERNQASALIVVPKGFQTALLEGRSAELELYKNPVQTFSPEIADSVLEMAVALANGMYGQAREPIAKIRTLIDGNTDPSEEDIAEISRGFFRAGERFARLEALQDMSVDVQRRAADRSGAGQVTRGSSTPTAGDFFGYMFPGLALFGLMFISQALAVRLLRDRTQGLQRRLLTTPVSRTSVLAGGVLYLIAASVIVLVLLAVLGAIVFRIRFRDPVALLIFGFGFALFSAGLQLTVSGLARSDRGAQAIGGVIIMLLSMLGGSFVPPDQFPPFLQRVSQLMPNGAVNQGIVDVLVRKRPFEQLVGHAGVAWTWAVVMITLAVMTERRKLRL